MSDYIPREHLDRYHLSKNGLYPDEILMLSRAESFSTGGNDFPRYWECQYHISNPQELLTSLEQRGFIKAGGLKETLTALTGKILKEELTRNGLKTTGKKEELVARILDNVDGGELEQRYPNKPYLLTDLGRAELKESEYVIELHFNSEMYGIGAWEMNHLLYFENPNRAGYRDLAWKHLVDNSLKYYREKMYGLYRNCYSCMFQIAYKEERYETAFRMLTEVLYFDLSGLNNGNNIVIISTVSIAPAYREWLSDMKEKLQIESDEKYRALLIENFKDADTRCPFHVFTIEECADICMWEMNGEIEKLNEIYSKAEKRMQVQG